MNGNRNGRRTTSALVTVGGLVVAAVTGVGVWFGHEQGTSTESSTSTDSGTSTESGTSSDQGVSSGNSSSTGSSDATTTGS